MRASIVALTLFALNPVSAGADSITGQVIGISDGDTLTLLQEHTELKIRLAAIDAPEKDQPFGQKSKQSLSDFCFKKTATAEIVDKDRYGRYVAVVSCGKTIVNDAQVQAGMAWVYRKYAKGFGHLYSLEREAQESHLGLWVDKHAIEPWLWRRAKREEVAKNK